MEIKDCLYGQVRAIEDNVYRGYGVAGKALPTSIPFELKPYVKAQQIVTWDNATGMNPLYAQAPGDNVIVKSYGTMLRDAYEISIDAGLTYVPDHIKYMDAKQYDAEIKQDHSSDYSMLCFALACWWHIHLLLNQPDVLDYDYIVVRQMDTWYYPIMSKEEIEEVFTTSRRKVLLSPKFEELKIPMDDIPVAWTAVTTNPVFPMTTWIDSYFFMFNRSAVKVLQQDFFVKILEEIEVYYLRAGAKARPILGKPGTLFHHQAIKNNITVINTSDNIFCWIPNGRVKTVTDYGRHQRNVTAVDL